MLGSRVVPNLDGIYEKSAGKLSIRMAKIAKPRERACDKETLKTNAGPDSRESSSRNQNYNRERVQ